MEDLAVPPVWSAEDLLTVPPVVNVVCYSYKGGSGRSTAAVNIAFELARQGFLVGVLDLDVDAPGLHMLMREWLEGISRHIGGDGERSDRAGAEAAIRRLVDNRGRVGLQLFLNAPGGSSETLDVLEPATLDIRDVATGYVRAKGASAPGELEFFFASTETRAVRDLERGTPAGLDEFLAKYERLQSLVAHRLYLKARARGRSPSDVQLQQVFLVIDAPNGINSISLPLLRSADLILTFFRHSVQHVGGTIETVGKLHRYLEREFRRRYLRILLVGSCFPEDLALAVRAYADTKRAHGQKGDVEILRMNQKFAEITELLDGVCGRYKEVKLLSASIPESPLLKVLEQPVLQQGVRKSQLFAGRHHGESDPGISAAVLDRLNAIVQAVGAAGKQVADLKRQEA